MDNNISEKQLSEYEQKMAIIISEMVAYLRELRTYRSMDFVLFRLDEIAAASNMDDALKTCIVTAIKNPDKPFSINFKPA